MKVSKEYFMKLNNFSILVVVREILKKLVNSLFKNNYPVPQGPHRYLFGLSLNPEFGHESEHCIFDF